MKIIATHKIITIIIAFTAELKSSLLSDDFGKLQVLFGSNCHELLELFTDVDCGAIASEVWRLFGSDTQIEHSVAHNIVIKKMINFILHFAINKPP